MKIAIIKNNLVDNVILWPDGNPLPVDGVEAGSAGIGWTWNGQELVAPTLEAEPQLNPIDLAEQFIAANFSTARLLQMKVWWDAIPHESTPKLAAVFAWADSITRQAIVGNIQFSNPPHDFSEIATEVLSIPQ